MNEFEDVVIGDKRYKIGKLRSDIGSWLLLQLMSTLREAMSKMTDSDVQVDTPEQQTKEYKLAAAKGSIQFFLEKADRTLFAIIQKESLAVVSEYTAINEKEVLLPIVQVSGKFARPEMQFDSTTVLKLTIESLVANLSPFFLGQESTP
jgi:hypothetical protein